MNKKYFVCHTDLDGFGCYVYFKIFMEKLGYDCLQANYNDFDTKSRFVKTLLEKGATLFFADITPPLGFLDLAKDKQIFIVDHHSVALLAIQDHIKNYGEHDIKIFGTEEEWVTECGCSMLFKNLPYHPDRLNDQLKLLALSYTWFYERVRVYDLWLESDSLWDDAVILQRCWVQYLPWNIQNKGFTSGNWDDWVSTLAGREKFERWEKVIGVEFKEAFDKSLREKLSSLKVKKDDQGNIYGVFSSSSMNSLICSAIMKSRLDIKYVMCINSYPKAFGQVSLRTREDRDFSVAGHTVQGIEFNGHKCAAGAMVNPSEINKLLN